VRSYPPPFATVKPFGHLRLAGDEPAPESSAPVARGLSAGLAPGPGTRAEFTGP
jgi:hypothetical protein